MLHLSNLANRTSAKSQSPVFFSSNKNSYPILAILLNALTTHILILRKIAEVPTIKYSKSKRHRRKDFISFNIFEEKW